MPIGKKKARELLSIAKEARRAATMENMSVSWPGETVTVSGSVMNDNDKDGEFQTDDFIRRKTRLYRQSWIISPLDEIIAELEKAV